MHILSNLTLYLFLGLMLCGSVRAAETPSVDEIKALRQDLEALKEGQQAIGKDIAEIKKLLQPPPRVRPIDTVLEVGDAPSKGKKDAKLTLVEFSDYQCPFCRRHVETAAAFSSSSRWAAAHLAMREGAVHTSPPICPLASRPGTLVNRDPARWGKSLPLLWNGLTIPAPVPRVLLVKDFMWQAAVWADSFWKRAGTRTVGQGWPETANWRSEPCNRRPTGKAQLLFGPKLVGIITHSSNKQNITGRRRTGPRPDSRRRFRLRWGM